MSGYYENGTTQVGPGMPIHHHQVPMPGYGYGYGMRGFGMRPRWASPRETKPFFLTSEFIVCLVAVVAITITAASSEVFTAWRAWELITLIVVGYTLSRGIAKAGTSSHVADPRDHLGGERHDTPQHVASGQPEIVP